MSIKSRAGFSHIHRYPKDGWVAGVCAGLAVHFDWNVKLLRVIFGLGLFFSGFFPIGFAYCVLWYLMDAAPGHGRTDEDDPSAPYAPRPSSAYSAPASTADVKARFARLEQRLRGMEECVSSRDFELRRELRKLET